ncbi:transporter substrate-binding domain-containing protein [Halomonas sp. PAMB 3264]|uniref:substrate-binding periplasmic protein n=1 Tax=Halomonas sp. PAMB 3264 TaxID=3075222 RepID=UPI002898EB89|nr:transporter substrate-binding domain-containing protein [Halomonas sp. PAMB 3264]WNL41746.1 transporter substrate-binding domain-containing protein [Halomonas sp. PAMB 3264]
MKSVSLLAGLAWCFAAFGDDTPSLSHFSYVTEEYPPYNHFDQGSQTGQTIDLLRQLFQHTHTPFDPALIQSYPWLRAYQLALETPNTVLFSTNRTPSREPLFDWVGPIAIDRVALIARREAGITLDTLDEAARAGLRIAAIRGDIGELNLTEAGYPDHLIHRALDSQSALAMLLNERVDLWAYSTSVVDWLAERAGHAPTALEPIHTLSRYPLYFAINRQSDPALVAHFQRALAELHALENPSLVHKDE